MKRKNFEYGIEMLMATFPARKFALEVYWELLKDIEDTRFLYAVKEICSNLPELYPNSNLIALIREKALVSNSKIAGEAWEEVLKQISLVGHHGIPRFSSQLIHRAVNCIGWKTICISEMISVERAHFLKVYDQLSSRDAGEEKMLPDVRNFKKLKQVSALTQSVSEKLADE